MQILTSVAQLVFFMCFLHTILGRHRIRHFRDRFKRHQGEHLYLAGSYVYDGGEGPDYGPWTEWSSPSPCSRSCGGGVSSQFRSCQVGYECHGPTARHFSCNTQDCPVAGDFRAEQCSEFDQIPFEGVYYQWIPYTKAPNPCELNCMPRGERFYYRHKLQVTDGTRCNDETLDVCVQGKCHPVGCDMMLGSRAREDRCRQCGGDGSTCNTIAGRLTMQDLQVGYNDILLIPAGATNVVVQEVAPSNNYLAVRNTTGHYYLNGNWRIDFPRSLEMAGTKFHYERHPQGFSAPDKLSCLGPTEEALFIVLLYQDVNVGVDYEYSMPSNIVPGSENETYAWTFDQYTPCSAQCGGGIQHRNVTCAGRKSLEPVDRSLCDAQNEPPSSHRCAEVPCEAQWAPYPWGRCSAPCGVGGTQTREVACQQVLSNGHPSLVDEQECAKYQPKPATQRTCNEGKICANWHIGPWKPCDHMCGEGKQTRQVRCYRQENHTIISLDDSECVDAKPETEKQCNIRPCEGVDWVTSEWSNCETSCGLTNETRRVQCATASGKVFPDELCDNDTKPATVRECEVTNSSCEFQWYASQWSECSATCGEGIQTRTLFCGTIDADQMVKQVANDKCDPSKSYETMRSCKAEREQCPGEWFSGPWGSCTKPCGGGERTRKVVCLKDFKVVDPSDCDSDKIVFSQEECNAHACSEDHIIPTDVTKNLIETDSEDSVTTEGSATTITDDEYEIEPDEECEDGEWLNDEGDYDEDDNETTTATTNTETDESSPSTETSNTAASDIMDTSLYSVDDFMLSDAPSSPLDLETGSGERATSPQDPLSGSTIIMEGSGDDSETSAMSDKTTSESSVTSQLTTSSSGSSVPLTSLLTTTSAITEDKSSSVSTEASAKTTTASDLSSVSEEFSSSGSTSAVTDSTVQSPSTTMDTDDTSEAVTSSPSSDGTSPLSPSSEMSSTFSDETTAITDQSVETTTNKQSLSSASVSDNTSARSSTSVGTFLPTGITENEASSTPFASSPSSDTSDETSPVTKSVTLTSSSSPSETPSQSFSSSSASSESTTQSSDLSTSEDTTEMSSSTTDIWSTDDTESTTEWSTSTTMDSIFLFETRKPRMCKRKKIKDCHTAEYGCCWDKVTAAQGPFDKGCPVPKTCKESKFGCCDDGVSPALGRKKKGCPPPQCNETLFGCCPDNKTVAQQADYSDCPKPPPLCLKARYGCCSDNKTAAHGPKQKGCKVDCAKTKFGCCPDGKAQAKGEYFKGCAGLIKKNCGESYFGCCPDGKASAHGPRFHGCKIECIKSAYGCCPDGLSPAHGPGGEGCCLAGPFGCCPDNITPARGINMDGCGCQYSRYGCCPDNTTVARGHNNEGCGCQYTDYGCCPDDYTPATGPEYAGCLCHTFQFGCCPDGISVAKGPHQQGCGCRNTEFGCCSDDQTPASGPNQQGCGCEASKWGCCLDGITEAQGEDFHGCEEIPPNRQQSCMLDKERGSCRNYTVKWFFDMDYGGCSRFWYGGCDGNGNRFRSKDECDTTCVQPEGVDRCKLPKVAGPCEGYYPHWFYDSDRRHCAQFVYGGCLGNNNRFETREECVALCVRDESVDACDQPVEEGPCRGSFERWYFNKDAQVCQRFRYGGCQANNNNFPTEEACKQQCANPNRQKDHCSLPRAQGNCTERLPRWYYDMPEKRCVPFYYSGCNGNGNNFLDQEECQKDCPKPIEKDMCHLAADVGDCFNYTERWYFDTREKSCRQFYYGGCAGNGNNFQTQEECMGRCDPRQSALRQTEVGPDSSSNSFRTEYCFTQHRPEDCPAQYQTYSEQPTNVRFYYDPNDGICKSAACGAGYNDFSSAEECLQYCGNSQDLCTLPPSAGPCSGEYKQFYFDRSSGTCQTFSYGGCGGNYNRFGDLQSCQQRCFHLLSPTAYSTQATLTQLSHADLEPECLEAVDPGQCNGSKSQFATFYFFDTDTSACTPFSYSGCEGNANRFTSEEECERNCGRFRNENVCTQPRDPGRCRGYFPKYFYDVEVQQCGQFAYSGCEGNGNRFSSLDECEQVCRSNGWRPSGPQNQTHPSAVCILPADGGDCIDQGNYEKRWYFSNDRGECTAFIYSGCGGNANNFKSLHSCTEFCYEHLLQPVSRINPQINEVDSVSCQTYFDECATIQCPYGVEAYVDQNYCNRCQCTDPCRGVECPMGTQCAIDLNRNRTSESDPSYIGLCKHVTKPGQCPIVQPDSSCEKECRGDADCPMELKCCQVGCRTTCLSPVHQSIDVPAELVTQPYRPAVTEPVLQAGYAPPSVDQEEFQPEVSAQIGDYAILRCAVKGNPVPRITWQKGTLLIDGTQAKYRIKLDQSLQIVTLHKTDSGIYVCTADNKIGEPIRKEIRLDVVDSDPRPASVLTDNETPTHQMVSLNAPAKLSCLALGWPLPFVTWWKDDAMIPERNKQFQVTKDYALLINSIQLPDLGVYTCQAYNGIGKAASWSITIQAKGPYHLSGDPSEAKYLQYIVNPDDIGAATATMAPSHFHHSPSPHPYYTPRPQTRPTPQPYIPQPYTEPDPHINPNEVVPQFATRPDNQLHSMFVPVQTNITLDQTQFPVGGEVVIPCVVIGNPPPQVHWYKDGIPIYSSDRIHVADDRLVIRKAAKSDSGMYQCEAFNSYSKSTTSLSIFVEGMYIHPSCKDNRFLANCALIVKARYCSHKYYARFCCRSCTEAGLLPVDGPHLHNLDKKLQKPF